MGDDVNGALWVKSVEVGGGEWAAAASCSLRVGCGPVLLNSSPGAWSAMVTVPPSDISSSGRLTLPSGM